jgi:hypothetical protein
MPAKETKEATKDESADDRRQTTAATAPETEPETETETDVVFADAVETPTVEAPPEETGEEQEAAAAAKAKAKKRAEHDPKLLRDVLVEVLRIVRNDVPAPGHVTGKIDALLAELGED